jgi:hypothetical protein
MAEALSAVLSDRSKIKEVGLRARRAVIERFSEDRMIEAYQNIYQSMMKKGARGDVKAVFDYAHSFKRHQVHRKLFERKRKYFLPKLYGPTEDVRILSGPFTGMKYHNTSSFGPIIPKWLGSYEWEIQDLVERMCGAQYENMVNVGSAEGYYPVGLAWRSPQSNVIAFDIDPLARREVVELAKQNGVNDRVEVGSACWRLDWVPPGKNLLFVDIEGAGGDFLDPQTTPYLLQFDILVELRELARLARDLEDLLRDRFAATHVIERRAQTDRTDWQAQNYKVWRKRLTEEEVLRAINEFRTEHQVWLWMQVRR